MSKIREFLAENPVVVGTGVVMAMMAFMDFGGDFNAEAPSDETAKSAKAKSGKKYFDLMDTEDEFVPAEEKIVNERTIASAPSQNVVDNNPSNPDPGYSNTFTETSTGEVAYQDSGSSDNAPSVNEQEDEPQEDPNAPGVDCTREPDNIVCVVGPGNPGPPMGPSIDPLKSGPNCDPNNPASECYDPPDLCVPGLAVTPRQGTYVKNPTISIYPSHSCVSSIHYCLQEGGGCCDPLSGISYTEPFLISNEDFGVQANGAYCLSVVAQGGPAGEFSPLYEYKYIVDDTTPDMVATFSPVVRIQSSEAFDYVQIDSQNFGTPGFSAYVLNSYENNPVALSKGCDEVVAEYPPITNALRAPAGDIVTPLDTLVTGVDNLRIYKFFENTLSFERNYLTAFVTFTDPIGDQIHSCQQAPAPLEVWDFTTFGTVGVVSDSIPPNPQNVVEFEASFSSFGHFGGAADLVGPGRSNASESADCGTGAGNCFLESGYLNIVN